MRLAELAAACSGRIMRLLGVEYRKKLVRFVYYHPAQVDIASQMNVKHVLSVCAVRLPETLCTRSSFLFDRARIMGLFHNRLIKPQFIDDFGPQLLFGHRL